MRQPSTIYGWIAIGSPLTLLVITVLVFLLVWRYRRGPKSITVIPKECVMKKWLAVSNALTIVPESNVLYPRSEKLAHLVQSSMVFSHQKRAHQKKNTAATALGRLYPVPRRHISTTGHAYQNWLPPGPGVVGTGWSLPRSRITLMESIGKGNFGVVYRGQLKRAKTSDNISKTSTFSQTPPVESTETVAIKTVGRFTCICHIVHTLPITSRPSQLGCNSPVEVF